MTTLTNQPVAHGGDRRLRSESGIALIISLMAMLFMMALGTTLILSTTTETKIANNFRNSSAALYAADAGLERSMGDLLAIPDWNSMLSGTATSGFIDGAPGDRVLADGSTLNVSQVLAHANCQKTSCSTADYVEVTKDRPWGVNNPRWQLFAYGPLDDMIPTSSIDSPFYVVVMVGDDPSENDGDPLKDGSAATNPGSGVMTVRAEAFGPRGLHKTVEVTLARTGRSELERDATGQNGRDEQNRRARKAAVEPPGDSLGDSSDDIKGIGQSGVRILSWREIR